ncbi:MAG: AI-2E family transporter [Oscillatoriales cyanobacterium]|uniref:AI-2E family transporter n=1 Tax=Microcoleus anatoxicus PTRS2 TaxID=2705321 RepID=A0ABU8YSB2_9CYAN|nr:MAG: AI-2E family transporter [Oscillatoriales cyanobacterium]TAD92971.1 MAG: AI-2E family transporter [Oscillatoriales cyanobacterium]TAE02092.1 MAG: AI-2E family transporter [Oscillatoriales cyanobacterium]TAF05230.1 MAG: AI-2E family transporter [Oscillatoriales cyanobacterium]TAF42958.1 MAG: AI-2E family transporter [Oscillatoriales cyanobacterium]
MKLGQWMGLLALIASCYILWQIRQALLLLFAAVVLATALNRLARYLQKFRLKRSIAVLLSISFLVLIFVGLFLIIVPPFTQQFQQLTQRAPQGIAKLNDWIDQIETRFSGQFGQRLPNLDVNDIMQQLQPLFKQLVGGAGAFVGNTLGVILSFLLVLVLTLMTLAEPQSYRQAFIQLFPSFYRRRVDGILDECEIALGRWAIGALISMSVITLLSLIGLSVLQVPLALAHAVVAGLLNLIPNIGPGLSVIPPMTIALLDSPLKSGLVLLLYFLIQQFESNLLTPYVMAQQVSLLPAVTLIAQVFFATFFGFLGLLLALPLTVVAQVWIREVLIKDILNQWHTSPKKLAAIDSAIEEEYQAIGIIHSQPESLPEQKTDIPNNTDDSGV